MRNKHLRPPARHVESHAIRTYDDMERRLFIRKLDRDVARAILAEAMVLTPDLNVTLTASPLPAEATKENLVCFGVGITEEKLCAALGKKDGARLKALIDTMQDGGIEVHSDAARAMDTIGAVSGNLTDIFAQGNRMQLTPPELFDYALDAPRLFGGFGGAAREGAEAASKELYYTFDLDKMQKLAAGINPKHETKMVR